MSVQFPIPRQIRREDFVAQAGQTTFGPVNFRAYAPEDVRVLIGHPDLGTFVPLVGGYATQLTGAAPAFATVTLSVPARGGEVVRVEGARLASRTTDVTLAGVIRAASLEAELDRITVTQQEQRRDLNDLGDQVDRAVTAVAQLQLLLQAEASAGLPSAFDLLSALEASAKGVDGAPVLSVPLPLDPVAAIARTIPPSLDSLASRTWHYARSGALSTPFAELVATALGLSPADIAALVTFAFTNRTEAGASKLTPYSLLGALAAVAAALPGTPQLSVPIPANPAGAVAAKVDPRWDSISRRTWHFARDADPGTPFSNLVRDSLGLSNADMLTLSSFIKGENL